ncbi:hypothetical protein K438DRAFT_1940517 [Mycena galopus ATCC 62051]|nr:hypothetical protein K438DRAFT_1940517 [Mycena galopus ATCC 62051]
MKAFEMCCVGDSNLSHASLTSSQTLGRLRRLPKDNPALHTELTQSAAKDEMTAVIPNSDVQEEMFLQQEVYDDCDIPLDVVSDLVGGSSFLGNFAVGDDGGLTRAGDAETSDPELEDADIVPAALGRGQRKKVANACCGGVFSLKSVFTPFPAFKKPSVHNPSVTVTGTESVQFRRACHTSLEHLVEMLQYQTALNVPIIVLGLFRFHLRFHPKAPTVSVCNRLYTVKTIYVLHGSFGPNWCINWVVSWGKSEHSAILSEANLGTSSPSARICPPPQLRKHFKSTSKAIYKDELAPSGKPLCMLMVIREVKHHWNYTEAIDKWVIDPEESCPLLLSLEGPGIA